MNQSLRQSLTLIAAVVVAAGLVWLTLAMPPAGFAWGPAVIFGALIVFTTTFGLPFGGGWVSLMPMTAVAGFLVMGLANAAWTVFAASLAPPIIHHWHGARLGVRPELGDDGPLSLAASNAVIHTAAIAAAGALYRLAGGDTPLTASTLQSAPALALLGAAYLAVNYGLAALYLRMRSRAAVRYFAASLPRVALYEAAPLIFASLIAVIYARLGPIDFIRFSLLLVTATLLVRSVGLSRAGLERRVREAANLQAVGQALGASLDLETVLKTAYEAIARLMPASLFYVALSDPDTGEISFPLVMAGGEARRWPSRKAGPGWVEHLLQSKQPLLVRADVDRAAAGLGLPPLDPPAASWLGAPLLSGGEALGALVAHSDSPQRPFDAAHRELLATLAAQAALAIGNARLYARTDRSLARRVQELNSILQTTGEGILLLNQNLHVLAVNRALADFLGLTLGDIAGDVRQRRSPGQPALLEQIGYTEAEFEADRQAMLADSAAGRKQQIVLRGPPERFVARILAPVRDRDNSVVRWLLVFHDGTEERALALLRDEWAHMLVHDLRAPVAVLKGTLDMFRALLAGGRVDDMDRLIVSARQGVDRLLNLINELLDINRLEDGQLPLQREPVDVAPFLAEVTNRLAPLTEPAGITVAVTVEPGLPRLDVDAELIARVMVNLLDNAIKFTAAGGQIRVEARGPRDGETAGVWVSVSDDGPGIAPEEQANLFQKFQQVPSQTRRSGTGLGLAFCKLVAEAHGGRIGVQSEPGRGTTLLVGLPSATERL